MRGSAFKHHRFAVWNGTESWPPIDKVKTRTLVALWMVRIWYHICCSNSRKARGSEGAGARLKEQMELVRGCDGQVWWASSMVRTQLVNHLPRHSSIYKENPNHTRAGDDIWEQRRWQGWSKGWAGGFDIVETNHKNGKEAWEAPSSISWSPRGTIPEEATSSRGDFTASFRCFLLVY